MTRMKAMTIEWGAAIGSVVGLVVMEFLNLTPETRSLICTTFPCLSIGVLGLFAHCVNETRKLAGK